ncbi:hypothetical protein [Pseudogracilibacillus auburnensis]|uniref:hypothetical protein n=1 Tax=Pseudogracilibacillus auburnensis TaxID=1494959 RepID=UPI001A957108|nr:hypothetical protein [Pseudogracilibacillus auburnensis]MBO1002006.1 hypothetical protein [Pseudogracilibacillus auburnensis]
MSTAITFLTIGLFCFTFVFWLKKSENKHKYERAKLVEMFIKQKKIHVDNIFIGFYFDLVNDAKGRNIWFFYLRRNTLQYKNIPYDELFQIEYKLDGQTIHSIARMGKLKRDLVVGNDTSTTGEVMENTNIVVDENYRVKEITLTILIDELTPSTMDFVFVSSHFPVELKNVKDQEAKEWFQLLTDIIQAEDRRLKN